MKRAVGILVSLVVFSACGRDVLRGSREKDGTADVGELGVPELVSPVGCFDATASPEFQWEGASGAVVYDLLVAGSHELVPVVASVDDLSGLRHVFSDPFEPGEYFWRVTAEDEDGAQEASTPVAFVMTAGLPALAVDTLESPLCDGPPVLSWTDPLAGQGRVTYAVQLASDDAFSTLLVDVEASGETSLDLSGESLALGEYHYRVRRDYYGCEGPWRTASFTLAASGAAPSELASSWDGCGPYDVTLSWEGASDEYTVEITEETLGFSDTLTTADTSWSFDLAAPGLYQWRVRGAASACADAWAEGPALHIGAGRVWTQLPVGTSVYTARSGHSAAVADDGSKIWIMAGHHGTDYSDVWSSTDGVEWTQETDAAGFGARRWGAAAFYDGRVWMMAGNLGTSASTRRDVWFSYDGGTWTEAVAQTDTDYFVGRHAPASVVFDDKLWIMGGEAGACSSQNDVWNTTDGYSWSQVTQTTPFVSRDWHTAVAFKGRMYVIGGIHGGNCEPVDYRSDVWSSADGAEWRLDAEGVFDARAGAAAAVFDDKIWVLGGTHAWPGATQSDVWYSSDGVDWCQATDTHDFSNRFGLSAVVFEDKLMIIGGFDGTYKNDVWVTE